MIFTILRWMLIGTGEGASSHFESGGFLRSDESVGHPDVCFRNYNSANTFLDTIAFLSFDRYK